MLTLAESAASKKTSMRSMKTMRMIAGVLAVFCVASASAQKKKEMAGYDRAARAVLNTRDSRLPSPSPTWYL